uniref:Uncharacterized protein n=1 Tax=Rhizophora mucronata TaxID=61149 RepID=A0A2P2P4N0_RHIMU
MLYIPILVLIFPQMEYNGSILPKAIQTI